MRLFFTLLLMAASGPAYGFGDEAVDYVKQVKPILATKCYACHGVLKQEAGLRLDTRALMVKGGDSGPVLLAGDSEGSLILERVQAEPDSRMPPAGEGTALKADEIALLRAWIEQGAIAPDEVALEAPTKHWAFQRIERPQLAIPPGTNPIDAFLAREQKRRGVEPVPLADRSLRIRRLYLDLIGLPSTPEQLHDDRPWNEIVDELLQSPQHGERWGRHWMDIWRYSDWYGLGAQLRYSQKHMWHWRDWIIDSLNADKGYDRMIHEMLAGDELEPANRDVIAGTGFLARNYYLFNRTTWLDSTIEHTGKAFLGLTLNCAKCHDHKYDPITHIDYYSMRAIFEPHQVRLDPVPGVTNLEKDGLPRVFDDHLDTKTYLHRRGDPKNPDKENTISPRVPALFAAFQPNIEPLSLPRTAYAPATRDYVRRDQLASATKAVDEARRKLAEARKQLDSAPVAVAPPKPVLPFDFQDDFDKPNPDAWKITGQDWRYRDGKLERTTATRDAEDVRLMRPVPRDFELTCRYTTTGGTTYKSVTFRFDESDDRKYANFVYTSAHAPGPKVQVAFTRGGSSTYPPQGRAARPIRVGETYDLRFAVRDRLVNVWLNEKFVLAYNLPDRRPGGTISLAGFDATVAYDWIRVRSLPKDVKLKPAKNSPGPAVTDPKGAFQLAAAKLKAAQSSLQAVSAALDADATPNDKAQARLAARLQAESLIDEAAVEHLAAGGDAKKTASATAKRKRGEKLLADAKTDKASYASVRVSRKALEGPDHKEPDYPATYAKTSTGRRLALARWITSRDNPLTARVAVNHVWLRHFGEPLVESVFDFGLRAAKPVHQELLDYLAMELIESGWSLRHLHRVMVTSAAYQRSSSSDDQPAAIDPTNTLYWRANTRRMESQVVRDSLLHMAGTLDLTRGGPSLDPGPASKRRSLYYKHSRDQQDKFLAAFDDADLLQCYRRTESVVPQQALAMANSEVAMSATRDIAARLVREYPKADLADFSAMAFETILGRSAATEEIETCEQFCVELKQSLDNSLPANVASIRVRTRLIHGLLNHNDFIVIR